MKPLGRKIPGDWRHLERYPLSARPELEQPPDKAEKGLGLPWWWKQHDQGNEGACVGFGCSAMMSIANHRQRLLSTGKSVTYRYDARWLYHEAQLVDEWWNTPPEEGTSVRAGCDILVNRGHRRTQYGVTGPEILASGISTYRWALTSEEIRMAIWNDLPVAIGINWYSGFDGPYLWGGERWIRIAPTDVVRGGHCVCLYRMSDRREAFMLMNSWGSYYPPTWISYNDMDRLLNEYGEAAVVTDR